MEHPLVLMALLPRKRPSYFRDCAIVLKAMIALGEDTRSFRAEEPEGFLHLEARTLRANVR